MHRIAPTIGSMLLMSLLAGCGQAASPAAVLATSPAASQDTPAAPPVLAPTAEIVANNTGRVLDGAHALPLGEGITSADASVDAGPDDPPELVARQERQVGAASIVVGDRVPYGVVVADRSAHTATISWATEVPTRGVIEYGRSWGFDQHGYTDTYKDDVASQFHKITLTNLRRWTGYEFRVTAADALGLTFPEQQRSFRTKFWAWR